MKKYLVTILIVCFVAFGSGSALAGSSGGGDGDATATATATGGNATIQPGAVSVNQNGYVYNNPVNNNTATGGTGGSATATIAKDAIKNTNDITIGGGFLSKTLSPEQKQKQQQGQIQGQQQGQAIVGSGNSKTNVNNKQTIAPVQDTNISNYVEDKRELPVNPTYQAPQPGEYRGPFIDGIFKKIAPWTDQKTWTQAEIDNFPGAGKVTMSDSNLKASKSFDLVAANYEIQEGQQSFYVLVDGDKGDTPLHVWGRAAHNALKNGATQAKILGVAYTFSTSGTGWNIGLGGGVNAINGGKDTFGGSVGGGTGYGSFQVGPIERMSIALRCYGPVTTK